MNENIDRIALKHFPNINQETALKRPILYSNWLSENYVPVDQDELREHVKACLEVTMLPQAAFMVVIDRESYLS